MYPTWDIPTRLFHWLLLLAVFTSWLSHELEWISVHLWSGYTVLVLVGFRLLWGFVGSVHSRFADFLRGPGTVIAYWRGSLPEEPGHNPAGGWSVMVLLLLILVQGVTGLFNSDGLLFDGPLHYALDSSWTDKLSEVHDRLFWLILGFIGLHIAAVLYYQFFRKSNIVGPMITGGDAGSAAPVSVWRALLVVLVCAGLLALAVYLAPEPQLPW